jgi:hypothetical protein
MRAFVAGLHRVLPTILDPLPGLSCKPIVGMNSDLLLEHYLFDTLTVIVRSLISTPDDHNTSRHERDSYETKTISTSGPSGGVLVIGKPAPPVIDLIDALGQLFPGAALREEQHPRTFKLNQSPYDSSAIQTRH